jgi:hypothetical protein
MDEMTQPLGFRRSTRKKLRRCDHIAIDMHSDYRNGGMSANCATCGAIAKIDRDIMFYSNREDVMDELRRLMPKRRANVGGFLLTNIPA